jgi:hypothetical protein
MEPTVTPRCFALLLADCLAPPLPAQEDDIEENRAALLKNAPPVSPKGKVTATPGPLERRRSPWSGRAGQTRR